MGRIRSIRATLYRWYGRRTVLSVLVVIILLVIGALASVLFSGSVNTQQTENVTLVQTATVAALAQTHDTRSLIGTVSAIDEVEIRAETGGRITSVRVGIGDTVSAGDILATFENSSQAAAVLQAEGAYEAAKANAAQSDVSAVASGADLADARADAWNTYRSGYTEVSAETHATLNAFFEGNNPYTFDLTDYSWERRLIRYAVEDWGDTSGGPMPENLRAELEDVRLLVNRIDTLLDHMYENVVRTKRQRSDDFTVAKADALIERTNTTRTKLNTVRNSITGAQDTLSDAQAAYERAQIGGTDSTLSSANAAVKQALGSLRAAQATYAKTIVRAPFAGVVNTVSVSTGEFVSAGSSVARVVNPGALEVTVFASREERTQLDVGMRAAFAEGGTGIVTRIAPAPDPTTQKYEVKIAPDDTASDKLASGDVVRVEVAPTAPTTTTSARLTLPLQSVKLSGESAAVLSIENGTLTAHPVTLGEIHGDAVEISGVAPELEIITDARGLSAGERVTVTQ